MFFQKKAIYDLFVFAATTYNIQIKTGDVRGAGTDANVFIKILGTKDNTGAVQLTTSENHTNKFEQGHIDMFKFDAADVGEVSNQKLFGFSYSPLFPSFVRA